MNCWEDIGKNNTYDSRYSFSSQTLNIRCLESTINGVGISNKKLSYDDQVRELCLTRLALTSREIDCYFLLSEGYRSKQIGKELGISYRTVEKHIENIKEKLQCKTFASVISIISRYLFDELS